MNQPDRYSRFVLPSGVEQAVEYKQDTKMRAAGQFNIWLEDHTLGNLARHQLLSNPEVRVVCVCAAVLGGGGGARHDGVRVNGSPDLGPPCSGLGAVHVCSFVWSVSKPVVTAA